MAHYVALYTPVIFECQNEPQGPPFWPNANGTVLAMMCYGVRARAAAAGHLQCASRVFGPGFEISNSSICAG